MFSLINATSKGSRFSALKKAAVRGVSAVFAVTALSLPAIAEDTTETLSGIDLWNNNGCFGCHGDLAAGGGDPANPGGPSLRRRIDHDVLVQTITCGRAEGGMPSFLKGAYVETQCNDLPVGSVPDDVIAMDAMSAEEIDIVVAWLEENVVGKNKITRANCALFFGGNENAPTCMQY